jgi:outer membrane receptor protein involved in Fe transport
MAIRDTSTTQLSHRRIVLAGTVSLAALLTAAAAQAQTATREVQVAQAQTAQVDEIIVTGTRVVRDGYEAPTPVSVVSAESILAQAPVNIADVVNQLPAFSGSRTPHSTNSNTGNGTVGSNSLNLRGLNANRTLVLLDGHRLVGANANGSGEGNAVDLNGIPNALISRVDVVTGGASAAYGSDALSGVVNFVLDREFTGVKGSVQGGISTYGDAPTYGGDLVVGTPFANGRGHVLLSGEYSFSEGVRGNPRPNLDSGFNTILNPAYAVGNGQPEFLITHNVGIANAAPGGLITAGPLKGIQFDANGNPYPFRYSAAGYRGNLMSGGDWELTRTDRTSDLQSKVSRKTLFFRSSYDVTDNVTVYGQAHWSHAFGSSQNAYGYKLGADTIRFDNPYIPAPILAQMTALGLTSLTMGRNNNDLPIARPHNNRTFRGLTVGVDGNFDAFETNWEWSAYAQRTTTHNSIRVLTNMINANYTRAVDSVRRADGAIVCRVNGDAITTNDDPACKPFPYFGYGHISQDVIDYVYGNSYLLAKLGQNVFAANVSGEPFSTWAGPVSLALGAEHRKETLFSFASALDKTNSFFSGNYKDSVGDFNVTEAFVETVVPLANDEAWAQQLDLNAGARFTDYSTSGYVTTWKIGATWTPIDDIRFRVTQSRDIRAPNLGDLYLGGRSGTSFVIDPFNGDRSVSIFTIQSGNPALLPEKANTTGIGAVFSPTFLPGFNASVDYYRINIKGAIATLSGQQIIDQCRDGVTSVCQFLVRDPATNLLTQVLIKPANVISQGTKGIDLEMSYRFALASLVDDWNGGLTLRGFGNHVISRATNNPAAIPNVVEVAGTPAAPDFRYTASLAYDLDPITVTLTLNGVSSAVYNNERVICTTGCPLTTAGNPTYNLNDIDSARSFDLSLNYKVLETDNGSVDAFFFVKNIGNSMPPLIAGEVSAGLFQSQATQDYADWRNGRTFRAGVRFKR